MVDVQDNPSIDTEAWVELDRLIGSGHAAAVVAFLRLLPPGDTGYTVTHLSEERRGVLLEMLSAEAPEFAADLLEHLDDGYVAEIIQDVEPAVAAAIVDEMDSDEQADVLGVVPEAFQERVLEAMSPEEADDVRQRLEYAPDVAGGLMITEYLSYLDTDDVKSVRHDLRRNRERYNEYEVRYLYCNDTSERFSGVVPMRELVMAQPGERLHEWAVKDPIAVRDDTELDDLKDLFDRIDLSALPVLNHSGELVGVIQRSAVQEAVGDVAKADFGKFAGLIAGEELRTMAAWRRAVRRLMFLLPIMVLMLVSASIIALFEPTVAELPILAAFLPVVAGICGSGGNQAVAVSMREVSLGLIGPRDLVFVLGRELAVAVPIGVLMGGVMGVVVWVWRGDVALALAVGGAIPVGVSVAKVVGGTVPLVLRKVGLDPAMASGPLVTTVVDLVAFFSVLVLAAGLVK
ncbi:MAG: magnesium transporter [Planctomycetota bacterium]